MNNDQNSEEQIFILPNEKLISKKEKENIHVRIFPFLFYKLLFSSVDFIQVLVEPYNKRPLGFSYECQTFYLQQL